MLTHLVSLRKMLVLKTERPTLQPTTVFESIVAELPAADRKEAISDNTNIDTVELDPEGNLVRSGQRRLLVSKILRLKS